MRPESLPQLAPRCGRCKRRHLATLRCWSGHYALALTRHVLTTQGRTCWMCGETASTADHILARSHGGDDSDANLRPACGRCNARRGNDPNPFRLDPEPARTGRPLSARWRTDLTTPQ